MPTVRTFDAFPSFSNMYCIVYNYLRVLIIKVNISLNTLLHI